MSYFQIPSSGSGGGLTEVATDATLTGDGTALDPLAVAVPAVPNVYSFMTVSRTSSAIPNTVPFTMFPMGDGAAWTIDVPSADFDIAGMGAMASIRPLFDGYMKVTFQVTFESLPVGGTSTVQFTCGLTEVIFPVPVPFTQRVSDLYIQNGLTGEITMDFTYIIACTALTSYLPFVTTTGDPVDFIINGNDFKTTVIAERIA